MTTPEPTSDLRVEAFDLIDAPHTLREQFPMTPKALQTVLGGRGELRSVMGGDDPRLTVIVGPCSVHDPEAAFEYAERLARLRQDVRDQLLVVMRVYFEKPRTTVGWKGMINDPHLDRTHDINAGLRLARQVLLRINELGLPCATEFLDPIVPQYLSDLVSWAAIGARTTESQTHREMASGLSMPVGFKNSTDGDLQHALNAMAAARQAHAFLGITSQGQSCVVRTRGNPDVHLVMRGGATPNYEKPYLAFAKASLEGEGNRRLIMVDCSHGNSSKDYRRQPKVFDYLLKLFAEGERSLLGVMLESNLLDGRQDLTPELTYGRSITDGCIDWDTTEQLLRDAAERLRGGR